jgi:hypothetical protein
MTEANPHVPETKHLVRDQLQKRLLNPLDRRAFQLGIPRPATRCSRRSGGALESRVSRRSATAWPATPSGSSPSTGATQLGTQHRG